MTRRATGYAPRGRVEPTDDPWGAMRVPEAPRPADHWYDSGLADQFIAAHDDLSAPGITAVVADGWQDQMPFVPPGAGGTNAPPPSRHRRPPRLARPAWPQLVSALFGALTAVTVAAVCLLGWVLSYDPLRELASSRVPRGLSQLWPVVVYGPWLTGCLSVLRAVQHGRQPFHSWAVVVLFSGLATGLCLADTSWTVPAMIVAGLPPLTAVISLHQLVRQLAAAANPRQRPERQADHRAPR